MTSPWLCPHRCRQRNGACASALFEPFFTSQLFLVRRYRLSETKALSCLPRCDPWRRLQRLKSQWLWYDDDDDDDGADKSVVWCCIVLAPVHRDRCGAALKKKIVFRRTGNCVSCFACFARRGHLHSLPFGAVPLWCAKIDMLQESFCFFAITSGNRNFSPRNSPVPLSQPSSRFFDSSNAC